MFKYFVQGLYKNQRTSFEDIVGGLTLISFLGVGLLLPVIF